MQAKRSRVLLGPVLLGFLVANCAAETRLWNVMDGNWFDPASWHHPGYPAPSDTLIVGLGNAWATDPVTIASGGSVKIGEAVVSMEGGLTVQAGGTLWQTHGNLTVDTLQHSATGTLLFEGGTCTIAHDGLIDMREANWEVGNGSGEAMVLNLGAGTELRFSGLTVRSDAAIAGNAVTLDGRGADGMHAAVAGTDGEPGSAGGTVTIESGGGLDVTGTSEGRLGGGDGGWGADGMSMPDMGQWGGVGGDGGTAGWIQVNGGTVLLSGTWDASGGDGGEGGRGGDAVGGMGGPGGVGGDGGDGGDGGWIRIDSGLLRLDGAWDAQGGRGGSGGPNGADDPGGDPDPDPDPGLEGLLASGGGLAGAGGEGGWIAIEGGQLVLGPSARIDLSGGAGGAFGGSGAGPDGADGSLTLDGGALVLDGVSLGTALEVGSFVWTSGTLRYTGGLTVDSSDPFGAVGGSAITAARVLEVAETLTVGAGGTLGLDGGRVECGAFDGSHGGSFEWTSGTLAFTGDLTIDLSDPFGATGGSAVTPGRTLEMAETLIVGAAGTLVLNGGRIECGAFDGSHGGSFDWASGTLALTGDLTIDSNDPFGAVGGSAITAGRTLEIAGTLTIEANAVLTASGGSVDGKAGCAIGGAPGSGMLRASGQGTSVRFDGLMAVGAFPSGDGNDDGVLEVLDGAAVWAGGAESFVGAGAVGRVTIRGSDGDGNASSWQCGTLALGYLGGIGRVSVEDGGRLTTDGGAALGLYGLGEAHVVGAGSLWESPSISVGSLGMGEVTVTDGGRIETHAMQVGSGMQGSLRISGAGSTVTIEPNAAVDLWTCVGGIGEGTLAIEGGGLLDCNTDVAVGMQGPDGNGQATVDGAGSRWHVGGGLYLGGDDTADGGGTAAVTLRNGGELVVDGLLRLWNANTTLTLDSGRMTYGSIDNTHGGSFFWHSGTLAFPGGLTIDSSDPFPVVGGSSITTGRVLEVGGKLSVPAGGELRLEGGEVTCGSFDNSAGGTLVLDSGTCSIAGGGTVHLGPAPFTIGDGGQPGMVLNLGEGSEVHFRDLTLAGDARVDGNSVSLHSDGTDGTPGQDGSVGSSGGPGGDGTGAGMLTVEAGAWFELTGASSASLRGGLGGNGGDGGNIGSSGGSGIKGYDGGAGGIGRSGGVLTVSGGALTLAGTWDAQGGSGGSGGQGGAGDGTLNNSGGDGGAGATGGSGGVLTVSGGVLTLAGTWDVQGGFGGDGGAGGMGGEDGGDGGNGGSGGAAGVLTVSGGTVTLEGTWNARGGRGGKGGDSGFGFFGDDGQGGTSGADGSGGRVEVLAGELVLQPGTTIDLSGGGDLGADGTFEVSGGTLILAPGASVVDALVAGTFVWSGGAVRYQNATVESPGLPGVPLPLALGRRFEVVETLTVAAGGVLELNDGSVNVGSPGAVPADGQLRIGPDGTLRLDGGRVVLDSLVNAAGAGSPGFDWVSGELAFRGDLTVDTDTPFGLTDGLTPGRTLAVGGVLSIEAAGRLRWAGGVVEASSLALRAGGTFAMAHDFNLSDLTSGLLTGGTVDLAEGCVEIAEGAVAHHHSASADVGLLYVADGSLIATGGSILSAREVLNEALIFATDSNIGTTEGLTNRGDLMLHNANVFGPVHNPTGYALDVVGTVTFHGEVSGGGGIYGSGTAVFEGGHSPGDSIATVPIEGGAVYGPNGTLTIELTGCGPAPGLCDVVAVGGDVTLAGTLAPDWLAVPGDSNSKFGGVYGILTYGGVRTGTFDAVAGDLAAYLDDSVFEDGVEYDDVAGEVKVHLYDLLDGDADLDGEVGRSDFLAMEAGDELADPTWHDGDFTFNGAVDFLDYLAWKANVGRTMAGVGIPEPSCAVLLLLGGLALAGRRRGGRHASRRDPRG